MNYSKTDKGINDNLENAIQALHRKGVRLWVENGVLRYRAPRGVITADDITALHHLDSTQLSILATQRDVSPFQPSFVEAARSRRAPLSFNQLAHWKLRGTLGYRPLRQVTWVTRICGTLHAAAMKEALSVVIERHDSLRTNIVSCNGEVVQEVAEQNNCSLHVIDMTGIPPLERDRQVQKQITSAIVDVFDYSVDPLFRPVLLKLQETEGILILAADHMVSDGVSNNILESEIFTAYDQLVNGHTVSLPLVEMQYADYALWQRVALADYFKTQEFAPPAWHRTEFPVDECNQGGQGFGQVRMTLELMLRRALEELARRRGTTLVMVVLATYFALVMRWCEVSETLVRVLFNGRTDRIIENTVGWIAYPLYLHVSVDRDATFLELLEVVTSEYCEACERPNFRYFETLRPRPNFTGNASFNWIPRSRGLENGGHRGLNDSNSRSRMLFDNPAYQEGLDTDLEPGIDFEDTGGEIAGSIVFPLNRFTSSTMARFAKAFRIFLDAIVESPKVRIRDIMIT